MLPTLLLVTVTSTAPHFIDRSVIRKDTPPARTVEAEEDETPHRRPLPSPHQSSSVFTTPPLTMSAENIALLETGSIRHAFGAASILWGSLSIVGGGIGLAVAASQSSGDNTPSLAAGGISLGIGVVAVIVGAFLIVGGNQAFERLTGS
jgi:hypothetical protein